MLATWSVWLPLLAIAGIFLFTWVTYSQGMASYLKLAASGDLLDHQKPPVFDYVTSLRTILERVLPLLDLFDCLTFLYDLCLHHFPWKAQAEVYSIL